MLVNPDGRRLASYSDDDTVRLWNVRTGTPVQVTKGPSDYVTSVAYSLDRMLMDSGLRDCIVRIWSTVSGLQVSEYARHLYPVQWVTEVL